jgi:hypothetical protein
VLVATVMEGLTARLSADALLAFWQMLLGRGVSKLVEGDANTGFAGRDEGDWSDADERSNEPLITWSVEAGECVFLYSSFLAMLYMFGGLRAGPEAKVGAQKKQSRTNHGGKPRP